MGPFALIVRICPQSIDTGEEHLRLPAHALVLEPLVGAASEIRVHGYPAASDAPRLPPVVAVETTRDRIIDTTREIVRGYECFWNAGHWTRGAVSLRVLHDAVDWPAILTWTEYSGQSSRTSLRKAVPSAAIHYAERQARGPHSVVTLTASNGLSPLAIWAPPERCEELDALAQATCRRFVRWVEHGKYEREVIYDRPPYTAFAKD